MNNNDLVDSRHGRVSFTDPMCECKNIALIGTGLVEAVRVSRDELLEAGYKIEIIEEPLTKDDSEILLIACGLGHYENIRYIENIVRESVVEPVKNSHHSNERKGK